MNHTYHIKMRAALWAAVGMICFASAPAMGGGRDMGCSPTLASPCSGGSSGGGSGGRYSAPSYDYGAARRAQEAAEAEAEAERQRQRQQAEAERQRQQAEAAAERQRQAEAERVERERLAEEKRRAEEKRQKDAAFIRDRDASANSLMGSSGSAMNQLKGLSGADNSGLMSGGFDSGGSGPKELKGSDHAGQKTGAQPAPPSGDPMVVDARNVPSGLPKDLDRAIATAYASAPPGVSDRVRKGYQAVMERDWMAAKAWFQDALNRDPDNAGLKRMIVLSEYSLRDRNPVTPRATSAAPAVKKPAPGKAEIDEFFRNFREGRKFTPTDKVRNYVLSMSDEEFKNRMWKSPLQLPQGSDTEYLFDLK